MGHGAFRRKNLPAKKIRICGEAAPIKTAKESGENTRLAEAMAKQVGLNYVILEKRKEIF